MVSLAVGITASMEHAVMRFVTHSITRGCLTDCVPQIPAVLRSMPPTSTLGAPSSKLYASCFFCWSHLQELWTVPELIQRPQLGASPLPLLAIPDMPHLAVWARTSNPSFGLESFLVGLPPIGSIHLSTPQVFTVLRIQELHSSGFTLGNSTGH